MNQQNKPTNTPNPTELPAKRKRGRPRKDGNLVKKANPHLTITPSSDSTRIIQNVNMNTSNDIDNNMVGQVVYGVIEGTFDAGYFLSVRAGNSNTLLRGVVFQPGQYTPLSAANDIAPQAKMYNRRDFPIPMFNPQQEQNINQAPVAQDQNLPSAMQSSVPLALNDQNAPVMSHMTDTPKDDTGGKIIMQQNPEFADDNQPASPSNLKMVEQDEVVQVFQLGSENIDQVAQNQNPDLECGVEPSALVQNEPMDLNLEIAKSEPVTKELVSDPMDIVTEKPISPKENIARDTQLEHETEVLREDETCHDGKTVVEPGNNAEGGSQSKPEFTAEECVVDFQITSSSGHAADVDFVRGDDVTPTQTRGYESYFSETGNP